MKTTETPNKFEKLALPFEENEIEWRLAQAGERDGKVWARCLAYVTSRACQDRFDQVIGPENWEVSYRFESHPNSQPGVVCKISIRTEHGWVSKEDGAEQTDIESFKGGISSAFKRAAVLWGVGRYLYGLEEGFAQIVQSGGRYGQTKDKKPFYWQPPKLPEWALPKKTFPVGTTGVILANTKPAQVVMNLDVSSKSPEPISIPRPPIQPKPEIDPKTRLENLMAEAIALSLAKDQDTFKSFIKTRFKVTKASEITPGQWFQIEKMIEDKALQ